MEVDGRRFPRISSAHSMLVEKVADQPVGEFAKSKSVGLGGCGFLSDESLGVDSHVKVMITVGSKVITSHARVAYERELTDGKLETGLEFLDLGAADRAILEELVDRSEPEGNGGTK